MMVNDLLYFDLLSLGLGRTSLVTLFFCLEVVFVTSASAIVESFTLLAIEVVLLKESVAQTRVLGKAADLLFFCWGNLLAARLGNCLVAGSLGNCDHVVVVEGFGCGFGSCFFVACVNKNLFFFMVNNVLYGKTDLEL